MSKPTSLKNLIHSEPTKLKLETLLNSIQSLQKIISLKLPVAISFKVGKTMKAIDDELTNFNEVKNKRIKELGEEIKNEEGAPTGKFQVTKENTPVWEKEHKELLDREIKIDIYKLSLSDFGDEKIEPAVFMNLDWLITE
jgi:hypothetical protein